MGMNITKKIILFTGTIGIAGCGGLYITQFLTAWLDITTSAMIGALIALVPIAFVLAWVVYSPTEWGEVAA